MLNEIFRELYEKKQIELEPGVFTDKWKAKGNNYGMISDIVDAMTHGHCYSKLGWWGHGKGYYKRVPARYMETFANFFAIRNDPAAWAICSATIPTTEPGI